MKRPASVRPDNIILMPYRALRQRRLPLVLRIVCHTLLLVVLALLIHAWSMGMQFKYAMRQHADALGQSFLQQTTNSASELLVAKDLLSLNILLTDLVENPLVAHAAIHGKDNRLLAEAGTVTPRRSILGDDNQGSYAAPIVIQDVPEGRLSIDLDMQQFQQPVTVSEQNLGLLMLALLILSLWLSVRLGRKISMPLLQLRLWLRDPKYPAPSTERQDEIGELARQLQLRLAPAKSAARQDIEPDFGQEEMSATGTSDKNDEPRHSRTQQSHSLRAEQTLDEDDLDFDLSAADIDHPSSPAGLRDTTERITPTTATAHPSDKSAVLAVRLVVQDPSGHLARTRQLDLLQRHADYLEQVAQLYRAKLHTLRDGSSLMLFHQRGNEQNYLTHALCCGELLRSLNHGLQAEMGMNNGVTLQLQLGLTQGEGLGALSQIDLLLSEPAQSALTLAQHSHNLLLVERLVAEDSLIRQRVRTRPVAKPTGACCVESLCDPYPGLLERQLAHLQEEHLRA
ncbi:histidine kinase [Azomonas macrocytogenes]|uniref:Putative membrane protein affecting hemolysin expression n=1 Tax=Azomonas macrocytogenes TaxID=69962 RepID=A0A839T0H4_AZOMA|nr:histidine kinase [Azomonas macrocytogenes]MBB3102489.1 putative membrane protein affecting hemolysin expression [Azomonas macrocytogenes]